MNVSPSIFLLLSHKNEFNMYLLKYGQYYKRMTILILLNSLINSSRGDCFVYNLQLWQKNKKHFYTTRNLCLS